MTSTASRPVSRVPGVTWYLHRQGRVITCPGHAITRQRKGADMHIPKLVCIPCATEMTVVKTGAVIEFAHSNGHKIKVSSDVYACPGCPAVTARTADSVITEGWKPDYGLTRALMVARFSGDKGRES